MAKTDTTQDRARDERAANNSMTDYAAELSERMPLDERREDFGPFRGLLSAVVLILLGVAGSVAVVGVYRLVRAWAASRGVL